MKQLTDTEYASLLAACRKIPRAQGDYLITDFVENLLLTVVDFQMHTTAVEKAHNYFRKNVQAQATDLAGLKALLDLHADDKEGNTALAQHLWNYKLWSRAEMLRRLVAFFESEGVIDQTSLKAWAQQAEFKTHFAGKVKGLGYAVFNWLIMRQGVDSIKPDVHVHRFIANTIGRSVPDTVAVAALMQVAQELAIRPYELDWAIWEQGRASA